MLHIIPLNDLREHDESTTCECQPKVEFENGEMIVIHNSFDGRESKEYFHDCKDFMEVSNHIMYCSVCGKQF